MILKITILIDIIFFGTWMLISFLKIIQYAQYNYTVNNIISGRIIFIINLILYPHTCKTNIKVGSKTNKKILPYNFPIYIKILKFKKIILSNNVIT